jgi:zinc protease
LWERLRQKDGLSYGVGSFFRVNSFEPNSSLGMYAIFAPQNLDKIRKGFNEELQTALKNGFTDDEVKHAKEGLLQERSLSRADDRHVAGELVHQAYLGTDLEQRRRPSMRPSKS